MLNYLCSNEKNRFQKYSLVSGMWPFEIGPMAWNTLYVREESVELQCQLYALLGLAFAHPNEVTQASELVRENAMEELDSVVDLLED